MISGIIEKNERRKKSRWRAAAEERHDSSENVHLVVEDLGLAGGSVGDKALVQDVKDILADLLELGLDLVAVLLDGGDVLVGALGLLLLLDGGNDAPRGTAGADDVLVGNAEEVALIDGQLTANLSHLLHVGDHLIVALGLLAEASQESVAVGASVNISLKERDRWGRGACMCTNLSR